MLVYPTNCDQYPVMHGYQDHLHSVGVEFGAYLAGLFWTDISHLRKTM